MNYKRALTNAEDDEFNEAVSMEVQRLCNVL